MSRNASTATSLENRQTYGHSVEFWFPGRWLGGTSLIAGPLLLLVGALLRIEFDFFFQQQLAAIEKHPTLVTASYSCILAGTILLWPAIVTLARLIGLTRPAWALWGGSLVLFGLFARTFHAGIDHLAFQLVRIEGLDAATKVVQGSYGAFHVVAALNGAILFGWIVLAIGAYRSKVLGLLRSVALGLMAALMMGVLKGSSIMSVVSITGLCVALMPLGVQVLREQPMPSSRDFVRWFLFVIGLVVVMFYFGRLG